MKYIIANKHILIMGSALTHEIMHKQLAEATIGRVTSAGYFRIKEGKVETYGESIGFDLKPSEDDADIISSYLCL